MYIYFSRDQRIFFKKKGKDIRYANNVYILHYSLPSSTKRNRGGAIKAKANILPALLKER
jgi:hypothetical protein